MSSKRFLCVLSTCALMFAVGCPDDDADATDASVADDDGGSVVVKDIEIEGRWHSSFGGTEEIDSESFTSFGSTSEIIAYDNDDNYFISQNPADAEYDPKKFNKVVWTEIENGSFYYCTVDFGLEKLADAKASEKTADDSDPETSGCGGFGWTKLSPTIEIEGSWESSFGGTEEIDSDGFTSYGSTSAIVAYDNDDNYFISQNPEDAEFDPKKFSKVVWTEIEDDSFYYCTVDFGLDTLADAQASKKTADDSDPENSGCGDFGWTKLNAQ